MPIGLGAGLFAVVLPVEKQNYFSNPNYEYGTAGGTAIAAAVIGTSSQYQQYGAWSLAVTPGVNGTAGVIAGTWAAQSGTPYTVSASIRADTAFYTMALADGAGLNFVASGSVDFQGGGTMHRYSITYTEASNTNRALVVRKNGGANILTFYIDGVQVEQGSVTTYFDGDTGGGTWLGAPHASQSVRSGQYRGGGSIVALGDLGLNVDQMLGVGVMPVEVSSQSYAVTPGAQFQRQRPGARQFTLTAKPISGTSLADFHVTRRTLYDAFKPDLVTPQQPVRLLYYGAQGTQFIDAYYQKGLELGNMDGPIAETLGVTFAAPDPYWYALTEQGTALAPRVNLGSVNFMAYRNPHGQWGTLGANGTTVNLNAGGEQVNDLLFLPGGTLAFGGNFGTVGGTLYPFIGYYFPNTNRFGSPAVGTVTSTVNALVQIPSGTIYVGGAFVQANGTRTGPIAQLNTTWGTLTGGTVTSTVTDLVYTTSGTLFASGNFLTTAGTATPTVVQWANGGYGSLGPGTIRGGLQRANVLTYNNAQNILYVGGDFTEANGTQTVGIVQYRGAWGSMSTGVLSPSAAGTIVEALAFGPNGVLYGGGEFGSAGGGSVGNVFQWNGVQFSGIGNGIGSTNTGVFSLIPDSNGNVFVAGVNWNGTTSSSPVPDDMARWNGASYLPLDIDFRTNGTIRGVYDPGGTLWVGGGFRGTAVAASITTIVNNGRAAVYPTVRMRNISAGTARAYQIVNTTTNAGIYFNYALLSGEQIELNLQPGQRSFQSNFRGNIFGQILPGSNLANFDLLPGTNYVSFFADNDSLETSFFWQPIGHAIDSGTVF